MTDAQTTLMIAVAFYFAPALVAIYRQHRSAAAIAALNVLLGWTALGWIVAIVWSLTGNTIKKTIVGRGWNRRVVDETALRVRVLEAQLAKDQAK